MSVGKVLGYIIAVPILLLIGVASIFLVGLIGFSVGWIMEQIGGSIIYNILEVIPSQPFSEGDFPKITTIVAVVSSMFSLGNLIE